MIARIKLSLAEQVCQRSPTSPDVESLPVLDVAQPREAMRGRAPPIHTFTDKDSAVGLDIGYLVWKGLHVGVVGF